MTKSTITREQLEEWVTQFDEDGGCDATDRQLEALIRQSLAAMDSEPVATLDVQSRRPDGNKFALVFSSAAHKLPDDVYFLYRHAQPAPVVPDDVLDALQKVARIRLDLNDFDGDRRGIADCLCDAEEALIEVVNRRAAMLQELQKSAGAEVICRSNENVQALNTIKATPALGSLPKTDEVQNTNSPVIPDGYVMVPVEPNGDMLAAAQDAYGETDGDIASTLRAAMLAAAPQSPGSEPATVPGKWIPVSERMPDDNSDVLCTAEFDGPGDWRRKVGYWHEGKWVVYGASWTPTHWMPLPAGPQEVK
ncbi:DUF551 domain-containing protein [Klebsiella pneumoniae]|nr:DUF551 domain-containing protein [Klebsiella pneumoniae]EKW9875185.1 DUF551 domain-containing protein [Klebsiella pneumoniae]EMC2813345.1 DUF551 domain-containing protein [Klebsiella pneumoniae]